MIFAVKLEPDEETHRYERLAPLLTAHRRQQIQRYCREADRVRSAFAGALSQYAVTEFSGQDLKEMTMAFAANGKPEIESPVGIHFNLSHSGRWVVCIVDEAPVGIDIERIRPLTADEYGYACTPAENEALARQRTERDRALMFCRIWTVKEAYLKATGSGLAAALTDLTVRFDADGSPTVASAGAGKVDHQWTVQQCTTRAPYVMAVASRRTENLVHVVDPKELYSLSEKKNRGAASSSTTASRATSGLHTKS